VWACAGREREREEREESIFQHAPHWVRIREKAREDRPTRVQYSTVGVIVSQAAGAVA
jgi:hypothetical protein